MVRVVTAEGLYTAVRLGNRNSEAAEAGTGEDREKVLETFAVCLVGLLEFTRTGKHHESALRNINNSF